MHEEEEFGSAMRGWMDPQSCSSFPGKPLLGGMLTLRLRVRNDVFLKLPLYSPSSSQLHFTLLSQQSILRCNLAGSDILKGLGYAGRHLCQLCRKERNVLSAKTGRFLGGRESTRERTCSDSRLVEG